MSDWIARARELLAAGMSVTHVCREIGKSEFAVRFNLNINGHADRYRAAHCASTLGQNSAQKPSEPPTLLTTITLPQVSLRHVEAEARTERRIVTPVRVRAERPGVSRIREIHQRMIRQGKIPSRDLLSEWRS